MAPKFSRLPAKRPAAAKSSGKPSKKAKKDDEPEPAVTDAEAEARRVAQASQVAVLPASEIEDVMKVRAHVAKALQDKAWADHTEEEQIAFLQKLGIPDSKTWRHFHTTMTKERKGIPDEFSEEYDGIVALKGERGKSVGKEKALRNLINRWRIGRSIASPGKVAWESAVITSSATSETKNTFMKGLVGETWGYQVPHVNNNKTQLPDFSFRIRAIILKLKSGRCLANVL